jgi:hypothetical protein
MIPYEDLVAQLTNWRLRHGLAVGHVHASPTPSFTEPAGVASAAVDPAVVQANEGFVNVGTGEFDLAEEGTMVGGDALPELHEEGELDVDADAVIDEEQLPG